MDGQELNFFLSPWQYEQELALTEEQDGRPEFILVKESLRKIKLSTETRQTWEMSCQYSFCLNRSTADHTEDSK